MQALLTIYKEKRLRPPSAQLKPGKCFPDLLEIPSYLEKIEYVRQI